MTAYNGFDNGRIEIRLGPRVGKITKSGPKVHIMVCYGTPWDPDGLGFGIVGEASIG